MLRRSSALVGVIFIGALFLLYVGMAHLLFVQARVWLNMVYPLMALVATYTMLTVYRYVLRSASAGASSRRSSITWRPTSWTSCSRTRAASASAAARRC